MMQTTTAMQARCKAIKANGAPCGSFASASGYCFIHDPEHAGDVAAARRKGGAARHGRRVGPVGDVERVSLATMQDVLGILQNAANDVLQLENSLNRARCIAYIAAVWARCFETSEIERRLSSLEERLNHERP